MNMVEYGAGGNIVHNEESNTTANAGANAAAGEGDSGAANTSGAAEGAVPPPPPPPPPPNPRRKRKAKGWFCPVCRQRQYLFNKFRYKTIDLIIHSLYIPPTHLYNTPDKGHFRR